MFSNDTFTSESLDILQQPDRDSARCVGQLLFAANLLLARTPFLKSNPGKPPGTGRALGY